MAYYKPIWSVPTASYTDGAQLQINAHADMMTSFSMMVPFLIRFSICPTKWDFSLILISRSLKRNVCQKLSIDNFLILLNPHRASFWSKYRWVTFLQPSPELWMSLNVENDERQDLIQWTWNYRLKIWKLKLFSENYWFWQCCSWFQNQRLRTHFYQLILSGDKNVVQNYLCVPIVWTPCLANTMITHVQ